MLFCILPWFSFNASGENKKEFFIHDPKIKINILSLFKPTELEVLTNGVGANVTITGAGDADVLLGPESPKISFSTKGAHEGTFYVSFDDVHILAKTVRLDSVSSISIPGRIERSYSHYGYLLTVTAEKDHLILVIDMGVTKASLLSAYSEMKRFDVPEAIKAQAIVNRSFYMGHKDRHPESKEFRFCDTTHCLLMQGNDALGDKKIAVNDLVQYTWFLADPRGKPIPAYSSATCGGYTLMPGDVWNAKDKKGVYSRVKCDYCRKHNRYRWRSEISDDEMVRVIKKLGKNKHIKGPVKVNVEERQELTGLVEKVLISAPKFKKSVSGQKFKMAAGRVLGWNRLFSNKFTISRTPDGYVFDGKGMGHSVGFCSAGAMEMASQGKSFKEILRFYFPKAQLINEPYKLCGMTHCY